MKIYGWLLILEKNKIIVDDNTVKSDVVIY